MKQCQPRIGFLRYLASGMTLDFLLDMMTPSAHWALDPAGLQGRHCIHGDISQRFPISAYG